jgi:hypothetical protein
MAVAVPIANWSDTDKVEEALRRSPQYMPADLGQQFEALLSPTNLAIMVGTLVVWAGSHFFGVGEVADVLLLVVGAFTIGWSIGDVAKDLYAFADTAVHARSDQDLDRAAQAFARAVVQAGITTVIALLLRRSAKQIQASRGTSVSAAIRPRSPGLPAVEADTQAGRLWRRPTTNLDASMAAGTGETSWLGDMRISTAGTAAEQQLARVHELVHAFLRPRLRVLRTFRARLAASSYWKSALLQYLEEAMAEAIAQLRVNGLSGVLTGIRFPIANGYITIQQLVCEGAEIGTILAGTEQFSVQFVPEAPSQDNAGPY